MSNLFSKLLAWGQAKVVLEKPEDKAQGDPSCWEVRGKILEGSEPEREP